MGNHSNPSDSKQPSFPSGSLAQKEQHLTYRLTHQKLLNPSVPPGCLQFVSAIQTLPAELKGVCLHQLSPHVPCEQQTDAAPSAQGLDCSWTRFHPHPSLTSTPTPFTQAQSFLWTALVLEETRKPPLFFHSVQVKIHLQYIFLNRDVLPLEPSSPPCYKDHSFSDSFWVARAPGEHTKKEHTDGQRHPTCSFLHWLSWTRSSFVCFWMW